jgi:hypothetical protein
MASPIFSYISRRLLSHHLKAQCAFYDSKHFLVSPDTVHGIILSFYFSKVKDLFEIVRCLRGGSGYNGGWGCAPGENYKSQNTNYKQTTIPKLQIPNKSVPFGLLLVLSGKC